ncbi:tetratricopeptide repeat protein [Micromonospora eburnea]|uniref:Tetratrico peptide repeat-containing protein n=1 Tax=Micromonospora eburnea TaxID=227316 RepID=A0A1C6UF30_9ACTN|nr:tetratricopeptide repeat protein [Micromonospora eburnea]SCL52715.1 Tetratrico peptide repeat-containing protein [Micromonospora eburnea]
MNPNAEWEQRSADLWAAFNAAPDDWDEAEFRERVDALADELGPDHPVAAFERACAWDSTGHSDKAVPLYRKALELGIDGIRRRRSVIQMSSSLRNMGQPEESVRLLTEERERSRDELDDAVSATLALALTSVGREREAVSIAVGALAKHLPRYQRSMANYARLLVAPD